MSQSVGGRPVRRRPGGTPREALLQQAGAVLRAALEARIQTIP
jgi:hypothetical protein